MKNRFVKKLAKMEGLPLAIYFLDKELSLSDQGLLKMDEADRINSKGYRIVNYYKPISKL
ncbi:hypothetical protein [Pedobacter steynii]|nr:hypothetical protein [Pedobacter steynii]